MSVMSKFAYDAGNETARDGVAASHGSVAVQADSDPQWGRTITADLRLSSCPQPLDAAPVFYYYGARLYSPKSWDDGRATARQQDRSRLQRQKHC